MKAKSLNKTQFVALGFVIPRITLENCEETAKVEFHNAGKMNRSTSKVFNQGNLLTGIYNKTILEDRFSSQYHNLYKHRRSVRGTTDQDATDQLIIPLNKLLYAQHRN